MGLLRRGDRRDFEDDFAAFYAARADNLRNTAYLLSGDWHLAQDLTQITFTKMYRWQRIERRHARPVFRRVLVQFWTSGDADRDRSSPPCPRPSDTVAPGRPARTNGCCCLALARVPKRQRAVLVLRFWMDMSVSRPRDLGCSTGTVGQPPPG